MALESNSSWIARDQHKGNDQQLFVTDTIHSQRPPHKVSNKQHNQTERFTQTEYRSNCVEVVAANAHKDSVMFEQTIQQHPPQAVPVQMYSTIEKKDIAQDKGTNITEFPFCYNVLQKVHQTQGNSSTTTAVASLSSDDKTCYRFDVAQPFSYNYALVNQMSLAAAASSATFKCDVCGLVFAHLSLLNHHKRIHNNNSNVSPERTFPSEHPSEIKVQIKNTPGKPRSCNRCGGEVIDCDHSSSKKKVSKYVKCENCQAGPTSTTTTTTTNGSFASSSPEPTESPPEIVNIANKGLFVKRQLATVTKCHKCNGSGIIFVGGTRPPVNDKPFRCNVCDGSFSRYSSLWSHKRLHTGDKPFKCDMCGLTFARAAYLKNHIRVHSGEKPYKCNVCGMQFSQSPHLKNHERIHSGERPYQCEVCEKTFARHSTLWNHRRIHTGEKPYRCTVCGSAFNQATHLKNHAKVHTGEKPHRCDICEVGFSDRFALKRHRLIHEKYGRTSSNNSQSQTSTNTSTQQASQMEDIYKCDVAFPGQQPNPNTNTQEQQSQQSGNVELYKCDVASSVTFSGAQQPPQSNNNRTSQTQQTDLYKCDATTSVSFPVQQQNQQSVQSSSSSSTQQTTGISEVYKVDVSNSTMAYQSQQSSQQQNSANTLNQQPKGQVGEMFKYDVGTSVAFPGQTQQSVSPQSNPPPSSSQHLNQYDIGASTTTFTGPRQTQQSQQSAAQQSTPASSQQMVAVGANSYPCEDDTNTILGS